MVTVSPTEYADSHQPLCQLFALKAFRVVLGSARLSAENRDIGDSSMADTAAGQRAVGQHSPHLTTQSAHLTVSGEKRWISRRKSGHRSSHPPAKSGVIWSILWDKELSHYK